MQNDNNKFSFTYSAPTEVERREIESIRRQYKLDDGAENKIERLKKLHSKVVGSATAASLCAGIVGMLVFGLGMALVLEFGRIALGIAVSILGIPLLALAYPIYRRVKNFGKKKYGDEILRLSDEILGE